MENNKYRTVVPGRKRTHKVNPTTTWRFVPRGACRTKEQGGGSNHSAPQGAKETAAEAAGSHGAELWR